MRIMAIDCGDARTGVAVSDESLTLTGDAWVVCGKSKAETARSIAYEAIRRGVFCIIVGHPKNMDGTVGASAEKSEHFAELLSSLIAETAQAELKAQGSHMAHSKQLVLETDLIKVKLWDERMTTMGANRVLSEVGKFGKKRKKTIDAVAASLILESYLAYLRRDI